MRFKMTFELENNIFPIQYHKSILSFIKLSLEKCNIEYYKQLYNEKDTIIKPYTFAVFFNRPKFNNEFINIEDKGFELNISIEDYSIAIILYNSFNNQRNKKFSLDKNSMILTNITIIPEKEINSDTIDIKFMSPLVVRNRNQETRKDYYHSFESVKFKEILKINIKEQLKISNISLELIDTFDIEPINAKKTVVKFYEKQIECSIGTFELTGDKRLLEYLYKAGVGSKRSSGFGMFNII